MLVAGLSLGLGERQPLGRGAGSCQHPVEELVLAHFRDLAAGQELAVRPVDGEVDAGCGQYLDGQVEVEALAPDGAGALAAHARLPALQALVVLRYVHLKRMHELSRG